MQDNANAYEARPFVKPTIDEVLDFADAHNMEKAHARSFFEYYQERDWRTKQGTKLTSWEGVLCKWVQRQENQTGIRQMPARIPAYPSMEERKALPRRFEGRAVQDELERLRTENERLKSAYERVLKEKRNAVMTLDRIARMINGEE